MSYFPTIKPKVGSLLFTVKRIWKFEMKKILIGWVSRILAANRKYKYYEIMQIQDQVEMSKINE